MSSNSFTQPNSYAGANGDFAPGENSYFQDTAAFPAFDDGPFAAQSSDNVAAANEQGWAASTDLAPDQFDLAHNIQPQRQQQLLLHHHSQQVYGSNALNSRHLHFSGDVLPGGRFSSLYPPLNTPQQSAYSALPLSGDVSSLHGQPLYVDTNASASGLQTSPYAFDTAVSRTQQPNVANTVAPVALQASQVSLQRIPRTPASRESSPASRTKNTIASDQHLHLQIPPGIESGNFVVTSVEDLEATTNSRSLSSFVHISNVAYNASFNRSTFPAYAARKSRNEIMKLLENNSNVKSKIDKKLSKKLAKEASKEVSAVGKKVIATLAKTTATIRAHSESSSNNTDEDTSSEDSEEDSMQPPLPAKRPADSAVGAVRYDTIKTLWRVPYRSVHAEDIRSAMQSYFDIISTIRDRWKSDASAVKQAEETQKLNELPMLRERVASQRNLLEASLKAAVLDGHKDFFEHFRQHLQLMGSLAVFLRDRAADSDYSGRLSKAVLEFLSRCKSMTKGDLEKSQIGKLLNRFAKRGDDSVRTLCKRINENAASAIRNRESSNDLGSISATAAKPAKYSPKDQSPPSPSPGTKRPHDGDRDRKQPSKKVAADKSGLKAQTVSPSKTAHSMKRAVTAEIKAPMMAAPIPVARKVAPQPSAIFSSLQPAYKKAAVPPTATPLPQAKQSISGSTVPKKLPGSGVGALQSQSAFSMVLDNLTKPRGPEREPEKEEYNVLETPEEKVRRLRRERRGKLKVSFKPDAELSETRYFVHDPEEELGHDASQVRDVGDVESEGRMFKLQHQHEGEAMDMDEDEDSEEPSVPWNQPLEIDFSDMPEDSITGNYAPYGGGTIQPESSESEAQLQREANTLLQVYSRRADIPAAPKEAPDIFEEAAVPKSFGQPEEQRTKTRLADLKRQPVMPDITALLGAVAQLPQQYSQSQLAPLALPNLGDIVARLSQGAMQQQQQHPPPPPPQMNTLLPFPTSTHQTPQIPWPPQQQPQQPPDISAILASLNASGTIGSLPLLLQTQSSHNLNTINAPGSSSPFVQSATVNPQHQQGSQPAVFENEERRRLRESGVGSDGNGGGIEVGSGIGSGGGRGERPTPKFVVQCKYFREGKCIKGANCTFRHDPE